MENTQLQKLATGPLTVEIIEQAEGELLKSPQVECPLTHRFAPGICIREVTMPANSLIIGHAHRFADMNIMLTGRMTILNDDGTTNQLKAPLTFLGKPGRKIAFIHEDVIWQNVFPTTETDADKVEDIFLIKSKTWKFDQIERMKLAFLERAGDRDDYSKFIQEIGMSEEQVSVFVTNESDQIPFPVGDWSVSISDSPIQGRGLFATASFLPGEVIAPARIGCKRTPAGRFTNHSNSPNSTMQKATNGDIDLVAIKLIGGCSGGQIGDEITVDYRNALSVSQNAIERNIE